MKKQSSAATNESDALQTKGKIANTDVPKVLVDGTVFEGHGRLGIWRLFYEIMSRTSDQVHYTLLLQSRVMPVPKCVEVVHYRRGPECLSRRHLYRRATRGLRQRYWSKRFPEHLWHPTFFSLDPRGPFAPAKSQITSVYDMIAEEFHWMGDFDMQREVKRLALQATDQAIAISEATSKMLVRYYPALQFRTEIIYLAGDNTNLQARPVEGSILESMLPARYCLFVGGRRLYKNFAFLVHCLSNPKWPIDLTLVVVGSPFDHAELAQLEAHAVGDRVVHVGYRNDDELCKLYDLAECFVFPSLAEGFGIPILESQTRNTIPVLSDIEVFREIGGAGALYFQCGDENSCIAAIRSAGDSSLRKERLHQGTENTKRFSWDATANQTVELYRRLWSERLTQLCVSQRNPQ